ncbi:hypothetical protein CPLU01_01678 [Colletotrichum plurivorum]|uniref:Uncharacterized protein n=1 Tax=Colletotrichum plurivorum TaxID=2175906 RepID=A0A8H6KYF5_9PEZI|nr:hypothetical protein CPLU01_01678 [Colletotrichum plurivorum]
MEPQPANDVPETTHDDTISLMILEYLERGFQTTGEIMPGFCFRRPLGATSSSNPIFSMLQNQGGRTDHGWLELRPPHLDHSAPSRAPFVFGHPNPDFFKASDEDNQPQPQTQFIIPQ